MRKAEQRLRWRIRDSIAELHHQVAAWLTSTYRVIVVPPFNVHSVAKHLFRKCVRGLVTLAHGRFREILKHHAEKRGVQVLEQNEAYTSKTCSVCGYVQEIGRAKAWRCQACGHHHDRDLNGARGILLRALGDQPWLRDYVPELAFASQSQVASGSEN